jgi:predicted TIM-barrel fold metal-dependent hydrolase
MTTMTGERLISADDHVDLTHDSVKTHLASKYHDAYDTALMEFGASMTNLVSVEANQRWREQQHRGAPSGPVGMGTGRGQDVLHSPGHRDATARLADMDRDGVDASVTYCEVSAFRYLYLVREGRPESTRAFNTALMEFASADPHRLVVSCQIPIHDIDEAVAEVQWAAGTGCKSLQLPVFPAELGVADYWDARYEPLFAAIAETGLPICCHIGMNTMLDDLAQRDPTPQKGIFVPMVPLSAAESFGMWIMGGVFERFPQLKVVFVEPGLGWVSWWLYIVDDLATRQGYEFPAITELPSDYFRRNVFLTFVDEPDALEQARGRLGIENVMWSSDYPHPVTSFPNSKAVVETMFKDADPRERELIVSGNAARVWNL